MEAALVWCQSTGQLRSQGQPRVASQWPYSSNSMLYCFTPRLDLGALVGSGEVRFCMRARPLALPKRAPGVQFSQPSQRSSWCPLCALKETDNRHSECCTILYYTVRYQASDMSAQVRASPRTVPENSEASLAFTDIRVALFSLCHRRNRRKRRKHSYKPLERLPCPLQLVHPHPPSPLGLPRRS